MNEYYSKRKEAIINMYSNAIKTHNYNKLNDLLSFGKLNSEYITPNIINLIIESNDTTIIDIIFSNININLINFTNQQIYQLLTIINVIIEKNWFFILINKLKQLPDNKNILNKFKNLDPILENKLFNYL